jgi:hypothetical protein
VLPGASPSSAALLLAVARLPFATSQVFADLVLLVARSPRGAGYEVPSRKIKELNGVLNIAEELREIFED